MSRLLETRTKWNAWRTLAVALAGVVLALATAAVVHAATSPDFSVSAQPPSQTIGSGSSTSYLISVSPSNGFAGTVALTAGSLPNGTSASWSVGSTTTSSASVNVAVPAESKGATATLTIGGGQPKAATYNPTVTAKSGSLSHTATLTLAVVGQNAANFGLTVNPSSQTVVQGSSVSSAVSITRTDWTGSVSLGPVTGLPSGASATVTPASTTGASATLTITAQAGTPSGLYSVVLDGSAVLSGHTSSTRYAAFTLVLQGATQTTVAAPASASTNTAIAAGSITSTLSGAASGATGTLTFKVFGPQATAPSTCTTGGATVGSATVSGNGTYPSPAGFTSASAGTYWWYASYGGDSYDNASTSACGSGMTSTLVKNTTTATAAAPATVAATATIPASALSATLAGATSAATGTVTFRVFGPQASAPTSCAAAGTTVGSATVSGNGTYHPSAGYTPASGGTYWWYASYSGDTLNNLSSSACGAAMASTVVQDFSIGASPSSQSALTGGTSDDSAAYAATITPIGGFSGTVDLSVPSGLPAGATASFRPASTAGNSTLTIDVGTTVKPGPYILTVQGSATIGTTELTRATTVTLVVQASQPVNFSGDVPSPLYPGAAAQTFTVRITNPNSFAIHVTSLGSVGVNPVNAPGCLSSWFEVTLPAVPSGGISVAANGGTASLTATARMINVNAPQDACQRVQLTLAYTGSYSK